MTSPHTHPAERETPAGEAMREAVALEKLCDRLDHLNTVSEPQACADAMDEARLALLKAASELARLRAERDEAREERDEAVRALEGDGEAYQEEIELHAEESARLIDAEAALTTLRADHAAEVARKDAEVARLRADLRQIEKEDRGWKMRADLTASDVIVEDDFRHFKVRVLGPYGRRARAALATTETNDA